MNPFFGFDVSRKCTPTAVSRWQFSDHSPPGNVLPRRSLDGGPGREVYHGIEPASCNLAGEGSATFGERKGRLLRHVKKESGTFQLDSGGPCWLDSRSSSSYGLRSVLRRSTLISGIIPLLHTFHFRLSLSFFVVVCNG